jgi:C1A family cysteine protease
VNRVRALLERLHISPAVALGLIGSAATALAKAYTAGGLHSWHDALVVLMPLLVGLVTHTQTTPVAALRPGRRYTWRPQHPDHRDWQYERKSTAPLPPKVDLTSEFPQPYDQGQLGSCTANAIAGVLERDQRVQGEQAETPSRLFIYYGERSIEGTVGQDAGAMIRDGIKVVATTGAPPERLWPYVISRFRRRPSKAAYAAAAGHKAVVYRAVPQTLDDLRGALADGVPVVFGFTVYQSFESVGLDGRVPMPRTREKVLGGHAVVLAGYDDSTGYFTVRNSWGPGWGAGGYCFMPYGYVTSPQLASDFWAIERVS